MAGANTRKIGAGVNRDKSRRRETAPAGSLRKLRSTAAGRMPTDRERLPPAGIEWGGCLALRSAVPIFQAKRLAPAGGGKLRFPGVCHRPAWSFRWAALRCMISMICPMIVSRSGSCLFSFELVSHKWVGTKLVWVGGTKLVWVRLYRCRVRDGEKTRTCSQPDLPNARSRTSGA